MKENTGTHVGSVLCMSVLNSPSTAPLTMVWIKTTVVKLVLYWARLTMVVSARAKLSQKFKTS